MFAFFFGSEHARRGTLDKLQVHQLRQQLPVFSARTCDVVLTEVESQETKENDGMEGGEVDIPALDEESEIEAGPGDVSVVRPRSYATFYGTLLGPTLLSDGKKSEKLRLWKRPPHDLCERCRNYEIALTRLVELRAAIDGFPRNRRVRSSSSSSMRNGSD
jgi:hypothetical protein